jgi:hypothetical protein
MSCCNEKKNGVIQIKKVKNTGGMAYFKSKIGTIILNVEGEDYKFNTKTPTKAPSGLSKALFLERVSEPVKETKKELLKEKEETKVIAKITKEEITNESI